MMPVPFYFSCVALMLIGLYAFQKRAEAWGLPACAVLLTVSVWYVGDALYNEYAIYELKIGEASLNSAWWQFLWFVVVFGCLVKPVFILLNHGIQKKRSFVMLFFRSRALEHPVIQRRIDILGKAMLAAWIVLMTIGLYQVKGDAIGLFAPYLGHKSNPWGRAQIGGGFSALLSLANYVQIFLCAGFGVLLAISRNPTTRRIALVICLLSFPFYIFDRTRNTMLATILPGLLAYVFLRMRGGIFKKGGVLVVAFLVVNAWFMFVLENRTNSSIAGAVGKDQPVKSVKEKKHLGLNMFEELALIDHYSKNGSYRPNWGKRYFAELMNPVPRALWPNKPTIGLDYAVARGQSVTDAKGQVTATISTGMIGQGVVNFGPFFGPMCSALLMSIWVAVVGRQDLLGAQPARLILYGFGIILTFNLGRDITLLVMYPFLFGILLLKGWEWSLRSKKRR